MRYTAIHLASFPVRRCFRFHRCTNAPALSVFVLSFRAGLLSLLMFHPVGNMWSAKMQLGVEPVIDQKPCEHGAIEALRTIGLDGRLN